MNDHELLGALLDQLPEAVAFKDAQHRFVRVNRAWAAWYGLKDPAEAVGQTDAAYFPRELAKAVEQAERDVMQAGTAKTDGEEKRSWPDGRVLWTSTTRAPLKGGGTLTVVRDIGPELLARQEVRRAEVLYRNLVDHLPQAFFRKDIDGRVVFANRRYLEVLKKSLKDVIGKTDYDLFPENLARKYREDDARVMQTGVPIDVVEAHKPPGRPVIHVRVVKTPVQDADKRAVGVQGIFWEVPSSEAAPAPARKKAKAKRKK